MIVVQILPVTKQKYQIITDEQPAFVLYKGEVARFHLKEGEELSEELFFQIENEILLKRAKLRAMHLLTAKDYAEKELQRKLEKNGYTPKVVAKAIEYVNSFHYLDDARYVSSYVSCHSGKKSKKQIEMELLRKGISKDILMQCDEFNKQDETETILCLLKKRCPHPENADDKEKKKQYMYLMGKGFRSEAVWQIISEYFEHFS